MFKQLDWHALNANPSCYLFEPHPCCFASSYNFCTLVYQVTLSWWLGLVVWDLNASLAFVEGTWGLPLLNATTLSGKLTCPTLLRSPTESVQFFLGGCKAARFPTA